MLWESSTEEPIKTAAADVADRFAVVGDGDNVAAAVACDGVIVPMLWESSLVEPIKAAAAAAVVFADACCSYNLSWWYWW